MRIGHGYDIHRLVTGRPLVLGGVTIPHTHGLDGHSDADALTHAVCDSLLGALALPDIGHFFPNTDARWKGVNSQVLLREVVAQLRVRGWRVGNVDVSLIAEKPKIAPHIPEMRRTLAASMEVPVDAVGIQATTNEKVGAIGREEAIAAFAVCLVERTNRE